MLLSAQIQKRCDLACLLLVVLLVSACLLVCLSACLYLDDEMTLLYFPSFSLLPLLYCTSSTVDSTPSLVYCAAVLCILLLSLPLAMPLQQGGRGTGDIQEEEDDAHGK